MQQPLVTIFASITRDWAVKPFLTCLEALKCDLSRTEVVFIIDTQNIALKAAVNEFLRDRRYVNQIVQVNICKPSENLIERRDRISQVLNQAR